MQRGFFGRVGLTPLLSCSINTSTYVSHTHLIENRMGVLIRSPGGPDKRGPDKEKLGGLIRAN